MIVGEPQGYCVPPHDVASSVTTRPLESSAMPARSMTASRRWCGMCR